jgi:hypothetical protein
MKSFLIPLAASLLFPTTSAVAATFYNKDIGKGTQAIIISGEIERGDDEKFRRLTIEFPDAWVALDSPGGALIPALEIGRLIRLRGYTTVVLDKDTCTSSCALMWLAGERRLIIGSAGVGFHASYIDEAGRKVESGVANALIGHYLSQLGLSQRAVVFATKASPDQISWLTKGNKVDAGIEFTDLPSKDSTRSGNERASTPPPVRTVVTPPPIQVVVSPPTAQSNHGAQATSTADILRLAFRAPGAAESGARGIGMTGALIGPVTEHLRLIYANDAVIERIAQEIDAAKIDIRKNPKAAGSLIFRISTSSIWKGLRRLPQRDLNLYFKYLSEVTLGADANCSVLEDTGRVNAREFEAVARLGGNHLQSYLALGRRAMFAEVENSPAIVTIDAGQKEIAENAWAEVLTEAIDNRGDAEATRLRAIMLNYDGANPQEKCEANKLMIPEISRMKGLAGDWLRRLFPSYVVDAL